MTLTLPRPFVTWGEFLTPDLIEMARAIVREHKDKFVPTTVSTGEKDFRSSVVLWHYDYLELKDKVCARINEVVPQVQALMQEYIPPTHFSQIEMQMTNHFRTGDKFDKHIDNGSADTALRRVSCVIYFNMYDEQRYTDGDLFLHLRNGIVTIKPVHNSVIFFPSHIWHQVQPIQTATEDFFDGRFTLNSWLHG